MRCLKCNSDQFSKRQQRFNLEVKETPVDVIVECLVCENCNSQLMDPAMMTSLRKAAADRYRVMHNLLTSDQIRAYRESLGMSQSAFARYLNVGDASIKRWETYFIQDASQDDHIRIKCDEAYAESNFLDVHWKRDKPDIYSGGKKFNLQLFKNVVLFLSENTKESLIILNKILFYADFLHFKNHFESITGARYVPLKYGPCPDRYRSLFTSLEQTEAIKVKKNHTLEILQRPNLDLFDDTEKESLKTITKLHRQKGGQYLYRLSHDEEAYTKTEECSFISYEHAKNLLL